MKKFTIIGLAICLAFALAAPVMATDADFSGYYRVRGFYNSHWNLRDTSASNAFMDMSFRLKTVFKASDILSVTIRFDALDDKKWGDTDTVSADTTTGAINDDLDFDRAYMTIKAPIGTFSIGRMAAGTWGTSFIDTGVSADRIKYVKKIDNLTTYVIFEKNTEQDNDPTAAGNASDEDKETYYLLNKYKVESTTAGLLLAFCNDKTTATQTKHTYVAIPYFVSKFGPLDIQGELRYNWGETDYDAVGTADLDIKQLAYNLEATYNVGPASIMAGYAFISGDNNATDNEDSGFAGVGNDWEKLFILTTTDGPGLTDLGGVGNLTNDGITAMGFNPGAKIIYGGATFSPLDNLELGVVVGTADADEAPTGYKDDYGIEYDFTLNWEIYDNLTYTAIAAFLEAGDFFYQTSATKPANFDDTYALFHQLELAF